MRAYYTLFRETVTTFMAETDFVLLGGSPAHLIVCCLPNGPNQNVCASVTWLVWVFESCKRRQMKERQADVWTSQPIP